MFIQKRTTSGIEILTETLKKKTKGMGDVINLTDEVNRLIQEADLGEGQATVFVVGSTAGITTIEFEPGIVKDMTRIFERLAPSTEAYHHHETWGDHNGSSHARAAIQGPSVVIPFIDRELCLGQWQQVVLMEFDDRPRDRKIVVQLIGK